MCDRLQGVHVRECTCMRTSDHLNYMHGIRASDHLNYIISKTIVHVSCSLIYLFNKNEILILLNSLSLIGLARIM